ncbi:GNAT family N-acetyltransferase [Thaumasiovibrio sp. DFM-14]|uniref:GNAT family N-acetyltransferase n=1 Tax=Thaumasiovibrio sp. DFM-14 TaxID=3384792 RepID=UPI0039A3E890
MEVSLVKIEPKLRSVLENLFQYYVYDMSEFMGFTPNDDGLYAFDSFQLDAYWLRDDHFPYLIFVGSELAGFALVRRYPSNTSIYDIEQFFVLRKFKGKGVGKKALGLVLKSYPGKWQIRILSENIVALNFWKSAVSNVVGSEYSLSEDLDVDLMMNFIRFQV